MTLDNLFLLFSTLEDVLWGYFCVPVLVILGGYLTWLSGAVQIRFFPQVIKTFIGFFRVKETPEAGVHPLKAFFACVGGCVGISNIVGITTAVQIGGPGALLWVWITAILGMIVKYAEVYLGLQYRVPNGKGNYNGGPMFFLRYVFKGAWAPTLVSLFLCIYGVEIYQFSVITHSVSSNLGLPTIVVVALLLILVIVAGNGGVKRVGSISSAIIPFFVVLYVGMGAWVLWDMAGEIPRVIREVISGAFSGHAVAGGFVGSALIQTISQGVRRSCYSSDIGIGYASVVHSESVAKIPEQQASLVIFDIFVDSFLICTTSLSLILCANVWQEPLPAEQLVQNVLSLYFPFMQFFMPLFLFLLGYCTINVYFCVGLKCAESLSPRFGRKAYFTYAILMLALFSFIEPIQAQSVMTISGGLLLLINCYGIFKLRHQISWALDRKEPETSPSRPLPEPIPEQLPEQLIETYVAQPQPLTTMTLVLD